MCGIIITLGQNTLTLTKALLSKIAHRGPDDVGYYHDQYLSIGFCRLSINDHSDLGFQPYQCKNLVSVTNGEVYNHLTLRDKYNLNIAGQSDTHVISELFLKLGEKCLEQLDGFYSSVIYDKDTQSLLTLRDHFGKKGLFLVRSRGVIFISSELKCFDVIDEFIVIPSGLHKINIEDFSCELIANHQTRQPAKSPLALSKQLYLGLEQATLKRIPVQGKFGVFLSGGLDSSSISNFVHQSEQRHNAIYYILGEQGNDHDSALKVVAHLGLQNVHVVAIPCQEEITELVNKLVNITESYNPSIISNGICTYLLSQAARADGLKVVLSGEGADELLLGYYNRLDPSLVEVKRQQLINDLHFTELRRVDLASMHHSIEVRAPFLDKLVHSFAIALTHGDLFDGGENKVILRQAFSPYLPECITRRKKESFDVGSGMRGLVVDALKNVPCSEPRSEKEHLKIIWRSHYPQFADNNYFHDYPAFNHAIEKRGSHHRR